VFKNSTWFSRWSLARDKAERVAKLLEFLLEMGVGALLGPEIPKSEYAAERQTALKRKIK